MLSKALLCFRRTPVLRGVIARRWAPSCWHGSEGAGGVRVSHRGALERVNYLGQGLPNANGQTSHLEYLLKMQMRSRDSRELPSISSELPFEAYAAGLGPHSE